MLEAGGLLLMREPQVSRGEALELAQDVANTRNRGIRDVAGNALDGEFFGFFPYFKRGICSLRYTFSCKSSTLKRT